MYSSSMCTQATWHPVYDLIVAGRYPDNKVLPGDQRTVDVYDANTGALVHQLYDPNASGIITVSVYWMPIQAQRS